MKAFHAVVGLILLVLIGSQFFRSIYARWIEPPDSKPSSMFQDTPDPEARARLNKLTESKSLAELEKLYAEAHKNSGMAIPTMTTPSTYVPEAGDPCEADQDDQPAAETEIYPSSEHPYSEYELGEAIKILKNRHRELVEVHYFWGCGVVCIVLGLLVSKRSAWLATSAIFGGFLEMLFAILPPMVRFGGEGEFEGLLTVKVIYSTISLGLLLAMWWLALRRHAAAAATIS